jgi:hypothetical protein
LIDWREHQGKTCETVQRERNEERERDPAAQEVMKQYAMCPGGCGAVEREEGGCNVVWCTRCRVLGCALCGTLLDSTGYDPRDRGEHARANEHFFREGTDCHRLLFGTRDEYLTRVEERRLRNAEAGIMTKD